MARLSRSHIQNLRSSMRAEMHRHLPKWRLLSQFIAPHRLKENTQRVDGRRKTERIINNQAGRSLRTFVSGMLNGATPQSRPWFNLVSNNPSRNSSSKVKRYYSDVEKVLNSTFQISNLYRVLPLTYKDVGVFSNSAFAMLPHARYGVYFYPFAIGTYAYSTDREGRTNMFTRDFSLTVQQVVETYATRTATGHINWGNIPMAIRIKWKAARYLENVILTQVIVPNNTYNPRIPSLDPADKKFQSYTYVVGGNTEGNVSGIANQDPIGFRQSNQAGESSINVPEAEFMKVSGFDYFPVITPRWEVEPEGDYGIDGPGEIALSDIMTLQVEEKYRLEGVEKLVRPPMVGHSSLRRHASSILAGGITYVDDRGMQHGFKPAFEINPQLAELIGAKQEIQGYIKTAFYEDLFRALSSTETKSHVTKAEVDQRSAETLAALSPVLGQWDFDMSGPIIENTQIILRAANRMPKRPEELEDDQIIPEYISVLAQASKASLITTQERFLNFVSSVSQALQDPSLLKLANGEQNIRDYAENSGLDPSLILDEGEYKKVQKAMQEAQAIQVRQQQDQQNAELAKTMSDTPLGSGSALDEVTA